MRYLQRRSLGVGVLGNLAIAAGAHFELTEAPIRSMLRGVP
jgi:hypothetical protein